MKKINWLKCSIFTILISLIWLIYYYNLKDLDNWYNYDDSKMSIIYEIVEKSWTFRYKNELNSKFQTFWFVNQWTFVANDGYIYPVWFFWDKIFYLPLWVIFWWEGSAVLKAQQWFSLILIVLFSYVLIKRFRKDESWNISTLALLLWLLVLLSPTLISLSNILYPQITILSIFLIGLYFYYHQNNGIRYLLFFGLFLWFLLWTHFSFFLIVGGFFLVEIFQYKLEVIRMYKRYLVVLSWICIGVSPTFIFNYLAFWSPIKNYYNNYINPINYLFWKPENVQSAEEKSGILTELMNFYLFNKDFFENHFVHIKTFLLWLPAFWIFTFIWFILIFSIIKNKQYRNYIYLFVPFYLFMAWLNNYFWYWDPLNIRPSIYRYLLPFFIILFLFWLLKTLRYGKILFLVCFIFLITSVFSWLYPSKSYSDYWWWQTMQEKWNILDKELLENTNEDDIIFVYKKDYWFVWLDRITYDLSKISSEFDKIAVRKHIENITSHVGRYCIFAHKSDYKPALNYLDEQLLISKKEIPKWSKDYVLNCNKY